MGTTEIEKLSVIKGIKFFYYLKRSIWRQGVFTEFDVMMTFLFIMLPWQQCYRHSLYLLTTA